MISKFFETLFSERMTKHDEICLLIGLVDSLANNEDSLSLNLSIDLILEQFTKILYRDSHN